MNKNRTTTEKNCRYFVIVTNELHNISKKFKYGDLNNKAFQLYIHSLGLIVPRFLS